MARVCPGTIALAAIALLAMNANVQPDLKVDLVFKGQVLAGFDPEQVKRAVGDFFKLDDQKRERMFSGGPQVIKRGMAPDDAARYVDLFAKLGARLHPQGSATPATAAAKAPADAAPAVVAAVRPAPLPVPHRAPPAAASHRPVQDAARTAAVAPSGLALVPVDEPGAPAPPEQAAPPRATPRSRERDSEPPFERMVVVDAPPSVFGVGLSGRLARRPYGAAALFGWAALRWGLMGILHHPRPAVVLLIGLGMIVAALWTFRLTVLRLHDVGLSGWWVLVGAVPLVGTVAGLLLGMVPGSHGDNRHGAEPDPGNPVLRMVVVVAVACIGAGFRHGLWLDDGGGARGAASALAISQADEAPQMPTDDDLSAFLKSPKARHDFRTAYWPATSHKAFASSDSGASGWSAGAGSADAARSQALAECDKARDAYSSECKVISVDAEWAD